MKIKCAAVAMLVALAFASQASAVLRPLFPIKPSAPFNGELIVIGDELVPAIRKTASDTSPGSGTLGSAWTRAIASVTTAVPCVGYLSQRSPRAEDAAY